MLTQVLSQLEIDLTISKTHILNIASGFQDHMERGLSGSISSLKMFPSYLQAPSGKETGTFLALDLGGSNARAAIVKLQGERKFLQLHRIAQPLSEPESGRDLRSSSATAKDLFDFLAGIIHNVLSTSPLGSALNSGTSEPFPLGFAFSFPYRQQRIDEGRLLNWDKELKTSGVVGKDVVQLLSEALTRLGLSNAVKPAAIINDTVATFLTASYQDSCIDIASIIGTGHNTCYLEQKAPGFNAPVIINTESGNFSAVPKTAYDYSLDQESDNPGEQLFEKKLSGKYLGELFRQIVLDFFQRGFFKRLGPPTHWNHPYAVSSKDMALILTEEDYHLLSLPDHERYALRKIALLLSKRSARLVASSLIGVIQHLDPYFTKPHTVAIDGSLYEGLPGYAQELAAALSEGLDSKADLVRVKLSAGGTLTGAAIAAALAKQA